MGNVFTLVPSGVVAGVAEGDPCVGSSNPGDPPQPWGSASGRRQMPNERSPGQQVKTGRGRERAERGGAGQAGVCGRDLGHLGEVGRGEGEAAAEASVAGAEGSGAGGLGGLRAEEGSLPTRESTFPTSLGWGHGDSGRGGALRRDGVGRGRGGHGEAGLSRHWVTQLWRERLAQEEPSGRGRRVRFHRAEALTRSGAGVTSLLLVLAWRSIVVSPDGDEAPRWSSLAPR